MKSVSAISRIAAGLLLILAATFDAHAQYSLPDAIAQGFVTAEVSGNGSSSGDSILITVERGDAAPPGEMTLSIPRGTVLAPGIGAMQKMVVSGVRGERVSASQYAPGSSIVVPESGRKTYMVEAYCAEFAKENPSTSTTFQFEPVNPRLECLLKWGKMLGLSVNAVQAAVWMETDKATYELATEKFQVSPADWQEACKVRAACAEESAESPQEPAVTLPAAPQRLISLENLTGECIHLEIGGTDEAMLDLWPDQKYRLPLRNGPYTFQVRYGEDPSLFRSTTLKALVNDSTTYIRLKPGTGKLARPANAKPSPRRPPTVNKPWREFSDDGNTVIYKGLEKTYEVCDDTIDKACFDGCRIGYLKLSMNNGKPVTASVIAWALDGRGVDAGEMVDEPQGQVHRDANGPAYTYHSSRYKPVLNMPDGVVVTSVTVSVTGCGKVEVGSVDRENFSSPFSYR